MSKLRSPLFDAIVSNLSATSASELPDLCGQLGLQEGTPQEAFRGKATFVRARIGEFDEAALQDLASRVLELGEDFILREALELSRQGRCKITELTRRSIIGRLGTIDVGGKLGLRQLLGRVWPLTSMRLSSFLLETADQEIWQHTVNNNDWDLEYVLVDYLRILAASDALFCRFLETVVHPVFRQDEEQAHIVKQLNSLLKVDGYSLEATGDISGRPTYTATSSRKGVSGRTKNLIFASTGPKPEIIFRDALNNDIEFVRNAEFCLMYDRPIKRHGLLWSEMVDWWKEVTNDAVRASRRLYSRLLQSTASVPEQTVFRHYYKYLVPRLGRRLPALIPQVYLHFDPLVRRKGAPAPLPRQRMDFLLLLSHHDRVVIEVDGKHHYATDEGAAGAVRYSSMAAEDRNLKLTGYEVFRFGAYELLQPNCEKLLAAFWDDILCRYGISGDTETRTG